MKSKKLSNKEISLLVEQTGVFKKFGSLVGIVFFSLLSEKCFLIFITLFFFSLFHFPGVVFCRFRTKAKWSLQWMSIDTRCAIRHLHLSLGLCMPTSVVIKKSFQTQKNVNQFRTALKVIWRKKTLLKALLKTML